MFQSIEVPLWLLLAVCLGAGLTLLDRLLLPGARWFVRRKVNRVLEEVGQHLHLKIEGFKLTKREVLIDRLIFDPEILGAAEDFAETESMPREVVMARIKRYAHEIVPAFNAYFYFRIGYWIARRTAQLLYRVRLEVTNPQSLEEVDPRSTVVFLMNHRSNMDYILVAYLAASRTTLSYAVGEWARIWPLQTLIKAMGAYFVRRKSRNALYRTVLARYISMATEAGVTQAMYPEGGLTKDGRLAEPKLGLLDYMLRTFDPDGERDLVFVPVGLNYDRVLEDRTQLLAFREDVEKTTPTRVAIRTLSFILKNLGHRITGRWHRFGYACVNFGEPISMRAFCLEHHLDPPTMDRPERFQAVTRVADDLMSRLADIIPVVPVALIATVLQRRDDPASLLELKTEAQALMTALETSGARVYIPRRDREYAFEVGLRMLVSRHIVVAEDELFSTAEGEEQILAYYANSIAHLVDPVEPI